MSTFKGKYVANADMKVLYTIQYGGGTKGRTVKKGEVVTALGTMGDINSNSVSCLELLHRMSDTSFDKLFTKL